MVSHSLPCLLIQREGNSGECAVVGHGPTRDPSTTSMSPLACLWTREPYCMALVLLQAASLASVYGVVGQGSMPVSCQSAPTSPADVCLPCRLQGISTSNYSIGPVGWMQQRRQSSWKQQVSTYPAGEYYFTQPPLKVCTLIEGNAFTSLGKGLRFQA